MIVEKQPDEVFERIIEDVGRLKKEPCKNPYPIDGYSKKTQKILFDIDENRNHSWIKEIWDNCTKYSMFDDTSIVYRESIFTYRDFFIRSYKLAQSLKYYGFCKGQTIVAAMENTPEFPFLMAAVSMIGGKVNLVSSEFEKEYLEDMLVSSESQLVFVSDMSLATFAPALKECCAKKTVVLFSIENSIKGKNPYKDIIEKYYVLDQKAYIAAKEELDSIIEYDDLIEQGANYEGYVFENVDLNDEFTITYTSGSTGWGRPKGLVHKVRSYITMSRYHDSKVSGIPSMRGRTTLALIKPTSDTDFMTNISDTFIQGGIVALEPINQPDFFLTSMIINRGEYVIASKSYWLFAMKQQMLDVRYKDVLLKDLFVPCAVGEPFPANEEIALNKWLRKMKAGINITKLPLTAMSIGGGDSEHGGIFIGLFRKYMNMIPSHWGIKESVGMITYDMVKIQCLRKDGTYCGIMEPGRLVANSPCTMKGYVNNSVANENFFIKDAYGNVWADLGTYGYLDKTSHIYVKGRIFDDDKEIKNYQIQDEVLKDKKNIMSCEVISVNNKYIIHIELQINAKQDYAYICKNAAKRCCSKYGREIMETLYFRLHTADEGFALLHTGKRNIIALANEGISNKCIKANI